MNSSPMILRLRSGSMTSSSASRKRSAAFTCTSSTSNWSRNVSSTCSASPRRSRPVSTNTHTSWSPIALCTERGRDRGVDAARQSADHALVADLGADLGDRVLDDRDVRPRGPAPAASKRNAFRISMPCSVCATSGWNCTP